MQAFEKLGVFYLGKKVDVKKKAITDDYLLYDSKDLTTHAVCVGMTGSGKTGLCISLLEEAAIDNIPSLIIDPKGDLGNLLLTFPDLKKEDFQPWINLDEANKKGLSAEEYAQKQADLWKNGLAGWGQGGDRIKRLRESTDLTIYTPGSNAGIPVSIIKSFDAPDKDMLEDVDLLRERIQTTASSLLELLGMKVDPLQSREHILLANIIEHSWLSGKNLGLGQLIELIQNPPIDKIGFFDLESFYPSSDRLKLAMTLNNLLAAPGFKTWLEGEPLDIKEMLYTDDGKPRTTIFSIAHLSDAERMFFVTLLLNQLLGWMRGQSGTTSLRALLYMDEVFGFLPPIGEPPSKRPLLTLLKQARAFGLGVVLATQNPVDLDYKGLSNTGTWFIGRLQTEKDKERLADGLTGTGGGLSKKEIMNIISNLGKRQFLIQNVHESQPEVFNTRWAMSYLRGPLTRNQIKTLMKDREVKADTPKDKPAAQMAVSGSSEAIGKGKPTFPRAYREHYAPQTHGSSGGEIIYHPYLVAGGDVQIINNRYKVAQSGQAAHMLPVDENAGGLTWDLSRAMNYKPSAMGSDSLDNAGYLPVNKDIKKSKVYNSLDKQYESFVYRDYRLKLWKSRTYKLVSLPDESERDFRIRMGDAARERRDLEMDRLRRQYARKIETVERQLVKAQQRVAKEEDQYSNKKMDMAISIGTTVLGALFGSKRRSYASTARKVSGLSREKQDISRAEEKLVQVEERLRDLEAELQERLDEISLKYDPANEALEEVVIRPKKSDIMQRWYGILWVPFEHRDGMAPKALNPLIGE